MSRIDELITKHCPDGVTYVAIADLFDLKNGYTPSKSNASFWNGGDIPWFRMEDLRENGTVLNTALQYIPHEAVKGGRLFPANSLLVATSATIGEHALVTVPHLSNQRFTSLSPKPDYLDALDMKFVYYYGFVLDEWCRNNTTTSSFASVDMAGFKRFKFPVPPLEVQRAIVEVLDTFSKLEAELEAELEARKQQYEHYSSEILEFDEEVPRVALDDVISNLRTGLNPRTNFKLNTPDAENHYITVRELSGFTVSPTEKTDLVNDEGLAIIQKRAKLRAGDVLLSGTGTIGRTALVDAEPENWNIKEGVYALTPVPEFILSRFLIYLLRSPQIRRSLLASADGSTVASVSMASLRRVQIPLPTLEVQKQVVALLDNFEALVNDLSFGLPAELSARRQQYEYYRDKLLTFKELEVTA